LVSDEKADGNKVGQPKIIKMWEDENDILFNGYKKEFIIV